MNEIEETLYKVHKQAARRDNASRHALLVAWECNGKDLIKSITCALMTIGGLHGPVKLTYDMIENYFDGFNQDIRNLENSIVKEWRFKEEINGKVPGFGSSFVKGQNDDMLTPLHLLLNAPYKFMIDRFVEYFKLKLYPNLAFYTAAIAHQERLNIKFCESIMIRARVDAWIEILQELEQKKLLPKKENE